MDAARASLALRSVPGVGDAVFRRLAGRFGGAARVMAVAREELEAAGVPGALAASIAGFRDWDAVEREIEAVHRAGARLLVQEDPEYPPGLRGLPDPPAVLRLRGRIEPADVHGVAVVGARDASPYGLAMAAQLARELAADGVTVLSGLAIGIDGAAHRAALDAGGRTIAVLGSGIDRPYPRRHGRLAAEIARCGAVVSELPCGTDPEPRHFPRRNRIVSGLSLAVVVVEAGERSGSLITARLAAEQGREVFVVPGEANAPRTRGTHALLRQGAALAERGRDVVAEALPWLLRTESSRRADRLPPGLHPDLVKVLEGIDRPAVHVDDLVKGTGLAPARALEVLLELEIRGLVSRNPGMTFSRQT